MFPAVRLSTVAEHWLARGAPARLLGRFGRVCNVVDGEGAVLSLAAAELPIEAFGMLVSVPPGWLFEAQIAADAPVWVEREAQRLWLGDWAFRFAGTPRWSPRPDWERLQPQLAALARPGFVLEHEVLFALLPAFSRQNLALALRDRRLAQLAEAVAPLAGLGGGLTPAGDDFLLGVMLALWARMPASLAQPLTHTMAEAAAPRTTTLSAAFLRAASRGNAGILWHTLLDAIASQDTPACQKAVTAIAAVGHSSGRDALAGFLWGWHAVEA